MRQVHTYTLSTHTCKSTSQGSQRFAWSADQSRRAAAACAGALEALTARLEDATNRLKDPTIGVGECIDLARLCRECCAAIAEMHSFS